MIDFADVTDISIPEGAVNQIEDAQGRLLWRRRLPVGYTEKNYISMTANEAFDTGIIITNSHRIEIDFYQSAQNTMYLYGALSTNNVASCTAYLSTTGNWRWGNTYAGVAVATGRHTAIHDNNGIVYDGGFKAYGATPSAFSTPHTLSVGRAHNANGTYGVAQFRGHIYSLKIYNNDALIADFVPCTNASGVYVLYDVVRRREFPSETGTNFTGG